jgi:hypothetical protein
LSWDSHMRDHLISLTTNLGTLSCKRLTIIHIWVWQYQIISHGISTSTRSQPLLTALLASLWEIFTHAHYTLKFQPTKHWCDHFWNTPPVYGIHTQKFSNKIEMTQRRAARFCFNDYKTKSERCVTEMINKLELESPHHIPQRSVWSPIHPDWKTHKTCPTILTAF